MGSAVVLFPYGAVGLLPVLKGPVAPPLEPPELSGSDALLLALPVLRGAAVLAVWLFDEGSRLLAADTGPAVVVGTKGGKP